MKKVLSLLAAVLAVLFAVGCGGGTKVRDVSMFDLSRAMLGAAEFGEMSYVSSADDNAEDLLSNVSDIEWGKVRSFFIAYATEGMGNADEIVVIAVSDPADVAEAEASLRAHLESRRAIYATYDPTQSGKLEEGTVFTVDNLAVLTVTGDNGAVKDALDKFISDSER
ncbi:MAG: DUF4358 domain-containing protein [Clostridia bacterium]|nr:DUF4358 domain-containing protein [Clostridia bacterium]